jgi:diguanylate cyclase (GGDEF)-like protein
MRDGISNDGVADLVRPILLSHFETQLRLLRAQRENELVQLEYDATKRLFLQKPNHIEAAARVMRGNGSTKRTFREVLVDFAAEIPLQLRKYARPNEEPWASLHAGDFMIVLEQEEEEVISPILPKYFFIEGVKETEASNIRFPYITTLVPKNQGGTGIQIATKNFLPTSYATDLGLIARELSPLLGSTFATHRAAFKDYKTRIANEDGLKHFIAAQSYTRPVSDELYDGILLVGDVTGLKAKNDTLGHEAGDELLKQTAITLASIVNARTQEPAYVARFGKGADEFGIVAYTSPANNSDIQEAALELEKTVHEALNAQGIRLYTGYTVFQSQAPYQDIFGRADKAMTINKRHQKMREVAARRSDPNQSTVR